MRELGGYLGVKVHACVGGTSVHEDQRILSSAVHVVGTHSFKVWWYFDSMIFHELDILACGIDVPQVLLVINYDLPNKPENCLYRIGQSGWFGKKGVAINFVTYEDERMLLDIQKFYNGVVEEQPANVADLLLKRFCLACFCEKGKHLSAYV
ncbi:hypothetical protein LguiB_028164 [Lonicera macranthoides]